MAVLLLSACGSQSSEPVFETRIALGPEQSTVQVFEVGEVAAGLHTLEVTLDQDAYVAIALRTPLRESSGPTFSFNRDAEHSGGSCQELEGGEQRCRISQEHGEILDGIWEISARNQSTVPADIAVSVIDAGPGWGAAGAVVALALILIAGFWTWWRLPGRRHIPGEPTDEDPADSRERLDMLRAGSRWGDISSDAQVFRKRRSRR